MSCRHQAQGSFRIGQDADADREVLADLIRIEIDVDDARVGREHALHGRKDFGQHVGSRDQHHIRERRDRRAAMPPHMTERPAVQRVREADVDFRRVGAPDVGADQLGDVGQLGLGVRRGDTVAHDDHWTLRGAEHGRHARHFVRLRANSSHDSTAREYLLLVRRVEDVRRQTHEDRSGRRSGGHLDGASYHPEHGLRIDDAGGPLGDRPRHGDEIGCHLGVHGVVLDAGLAGDHDERRPAAFGLVQVADGITHARAGVNLNERRLPGSARVAVRYQNGDRLLQRQHVLQLGVVGESIQKALLDRARIPEHMREPVGDELLDQCEASAPTGHERSPAPTPEALIEYLDELLTRLVRVRRRTAGDNG